MERIDELNEFILVKIPAKLSISISNYSPSNSLSEENPPLHIFSGTDAIELTNNKIEMLRKEIKRWQK